MQPNNEFTTDQVRFFYPMNGAVEYHESFDRTNTPSLEQVPGNDHHVVIETIDGRLYSTELCWDHPNIPAGSKVLGIRGFLEDSIPQKFIEADEFEQYESTDYVPTDGSKMLVKVEIIGNSGDYDDPRFSKDGIAILPAGEALPTFGETDPDSRMVKYQLLGFIDGGDKLISWKSENTYTNKLIDWSVANSAKQNYAEESLLNTALPREGHLIGMLSTRDDARTYLEYFDNKHGTSFLPTKDPRWPYSERKFDNPTETDMRTIRELSKAAHHFLTNPR